MPTETEYAEQKFANGLGRRAAFGCCADCGATLQDVTLLVCKKCARNHVDDADFEARSAGHRERVTDLFRGARDSSLTFEKANAIYRKKLKAQEVKAA